MRTYAHYITTYTYIYVQGERKNLFSHHPRADGQEGAPRALCVHGGSPKGWTSEGYFFLPAPRDIATITDLSSPPGYMMDR